MQKKLMFLVKSCKFISMKNKIIIRSVFLIIYLTFGWAVLAQDESQIKDFYSPYFIGGTASITNSMSPQSDAVNPASGALVQRIILDLSYVGIFGQEDSFNGLKGHGINIGNTIPTKAGVFSWSGHYLTSPFPSVDSNSIFSLNGSFAKELYPDLLAGAGLKLAGSFEQDFEALTLFLGAGLTPNEAGKIIKKYGDDAVGIMTTNPYLVLRFGQYDILDRRSCGRGFPCAGRRRRGGVGPRLRSRRRSSASRSPP